MTPRTALTATTAVCVLAAVLILAPATALASTDDPAPITLTSSDSLAIEAVSNVIGLFSLVGDAAWPGFDLARHPFITYMPERWALLVNAPVPVDAFAEYPADWPPLDAQAAVRTGPLGTLVGQLVFDLDLGSFVTLAIPLSGPASQDRRGAIGNGFTFIAHEAFHQYQHDEFVSIPDDMADEEYPMLDAGNTALASLEARLLMDAVSAADRHDRDEATALAEEFVGVRRARWARDPEFLPAYERPQELIEGTAKYVEVRCVGLMGDLCRDIARGGRPGTAPPSGYDVFGDVTLVGYLLADFEDRIEGGVIEPSDMPRNRMYPVAAATAVLLDYFVADWRGRAMDAAVSPGLAEMLGEALEVEPALTESLVVRAARRYDYADMRARCEEQAAAYPPAYQAAVDSLLALPGFHVTVEAAVSGLSRSRSCSGQRWTLSGPQRSFSTSCAAYALKSMGSDVLFVEIHDSGIAEEASADGRTRAATFLAPGVTTALVDGEPVDMGAPVELGAPVDTAAPAKRRFTRLELEGPNFTIRYEGEGSLAVEGTRVTVRLLPPTPTW